MLDRQLKIARGFELPLDVVTEATGIVATRGAGKSSASAVIVEEAFYAGVQTIVFDRTGVYWGLRSNAGGDGPGLAIYVLGGPHGDVPLEAAAGRMIADLAVDTGHSFVLDLSDFSKSAAIRFAADFLERLYDRKARSRATTLLVLDEAHFYAPQTPRGGFKGDGARLMGAMEDVVGLGRSRGLGVVLTTQRTQALNKAVLDLIETLLVMRMLSPRARDAVKDWIQEKHEDDEKGVIASLDSLPTGTAWVWAPLRGILERVAVRRIRTFDSYATPKPGETRIEPSVRKELDLNALGEQMRSTVERAKADDPKELRKQIHELHRQLQIAGERAQDEPVKIIEQIEVPALQEGELVFLESALQDLQEESGHIQTAATEIAGNVALLQNALDTAKEIRDEITSSPQPAPVIPTPRPPVLERSTSTVQASSNGEVESGAMKLAELLARRYPMKMTREQLATMAGRSKKSSSWGPHVRQIISAGYAIEEGRLISAGPRALDEFPESAPQTIDDVLQVWRSALPAGAWRMLEGIRAAGQVSTREELAEVAGMSPTSSGVGSSLKILKDNGLVDVDGSVVKPSTILV